ncbi:MAG TPA: class I SAM-dependent methyltransferase [Pyrinomonadaceae bacterium]|jgi:SAM-dependent methyltransferase|nr:class I SAM-dependent methyltransferase [Pyrinomonadaceae bacterium]
MFQQTVSISATSASYSGEPLNESKFSSDSRDTKRNLWWRAIQRRLQRERRRRKVGRAYDMALEIARVLPVKTRVLDVGCGSGFIAHHLSAMLQQSVVGVDLDTHTEAAIDYRQFDGKHLPLADGSIDAVLLCYVLHHAQDVDEVMSELRRVLGARGYAVIYEDIPAVWWDRMICWTHNLKWRKRTGPCTFRRESEWRALFTAAGFQVVAERQLSRWRNLFHPVRRRFYLLEMSAARLAVN